MTSLRNLLLLSILHFSLYLTVFCQDPCSRASLPAFRRICQQFQLHRTRHNEQPRTSPQAGSGGFGMQGNPSLLSATNAKLSEGPSIGQAGIGGPPPTDKLIGVDWQDHREPSSIVECQDFECLCNELQGIYRGANDCMLSNGQFLRKAIRKEYRTLTDDERTRFHNAINRLKMSKVYDHFHALHYHYSYNSGIHMGPVFAPWHREFIKRYEIALREIDPTIALPYWDTTMDQILPDPKDSIMWTADFMGSVDNNGYLNSGPFASWITLEVANKFVHTDSEIEEKKVPIKKLGNNRIRRNLGVPDGNRLIADLNITRILTNNNIYLIFGDEQFKILNGSCSSLNWLEGYDDTFWLDMTLESIHALVHQYVGGMDDNHELGDMAEFQTAVGDPVFFLLHGFIDFIFEMWRQTHQSRIEREITYREPNSECHNSEHYIYKHMRPFKFQGDYIININGLSNKYTDQLYEYEPRPRCDVKNCGSKYLFCDNSKNQKHCGVKIKVSGNCSGLLNSDNPCYNGWCRNIDDGRPCFQCRRGSCVAGQNRTDQISQIRNLSVPNHDRPLYTTRPPYHTTSRPYASPNQVTHSPSIKVKNVYEPNRPFTCQNYGCNDANLCCPYWAQQGQCQANPSWMSCNCRLSCGFCNATINYRDSLNCYDSRNECFEWSRQGSCVRNPSYMLQNCRQSCRVCLSLAELQLMCV